MMDDECCTIFDLDIRELTRQWICAEATEKGCETEAALDMIIKEWKNWKVIRQEEISTNTPNLDLLLDTTSLSDDVADKVIQRLKNEFVLTIE